MHIDSTLIERSILSNKFSISIAPASIVAHRCPGILAPGLATPPFPGASAKFGSILAREILEEDGAIAAFPKAALPPELAEADAAGRSR